MASQPLVSLILCVKDGMPYLPEAVWSVAAQSYREFELVVQDGQSSDGTLEFLRSVSGLPSLQIESAADSGIGEAYNRAVRRCRGEIIGSIDADNLLERDALATVVELFGRNTGAAAIYGASKMIDEQGNVVSSFAPGAFDLVSVMACELVPPFATSFFSRGVCGDELRFDEELKTCADFDLWLRLGHLPIVATERVLGSTRLSPNSSTCRLESYEPFCAAKTSALRRYLVPYGSDALLESFFKHCAAGIYLWAAESVLRLGGEPGLCRRFMLEAQALHPISERLASIERRLADTAWKTPRRDERRPAARGATAGADPAARRNTPERRIGEMVRPSEAADTKAVEAFDAGRRCFEGGDWDDAVRELSRALDLNPVLEKAQYFLGCAELQRGRPEAAAAALRAAAHQTPHDADVHDALGVALSAAGSAREAERAFREALTLAPDRADTWANLGELYEHDMRLAEAAAAYARALALAPEDAVARQGLVRVQEARLAASWYPSGGLLF